jgi:hypothetical protein
MKNRIKIQLFFHLKYNSAKKILSIFKVIFYINFLSRIVMFFFQYITITTISADWAQ